MGGGNKSLFTKVLDVITHKLPESPRGASHYEVLVVGKGLGASFTKRFSHKTHGHATLCSVTTGGSAFMNVNRFLYEQGRLKKTDTFVNTKLAVCMSAATSDGFAVQKYLPDENAVVLTNGRRIDYDHLVVASGMKYDLENIPGFYEAWGDIDCPVYSTIDHPKWPVTMTPEQKFMGNYFHGDAYFYIPEGNFRGEVSAYNFLATSKIWDWYKTIGKLSPTAKYHVVMANDGTFCKHDTATNDFFKAECERRGIEVITGKRLHSVDGAAKTMTLECVNSGATETRDFNNLYAIPSANPHPELMDSGLGTSSTGGYLDVDPHTLRHNRYPNVFGLGDCNNLPTTKTWHGGVHQLHVVANNVYRNLKGLPLNAKYDGHAKTPIYLDGAGLTWMVHNYDGPQSGNLSMSSGWTAPRYFWWAKGMANKTVSGAYLSKSNGPPKYKLGEPKWSELSAEDANKPNAMGYKVIRKDGVEPSHAH